MTRRTGSIGFCALLLVLAMSVPAPRAAQAAESPAALHGGAWAVEFDRNMGSTYLSENEISIKRMNGASSAFRLSLGVYYNGGSGDGTETTVPGGGTIGLTQANFNRSYTVRFDWVHHFATASNFDASLGIGPVATFSSNSYGNTDASGYVSNSSYRTHQVGGEVNLGAEWFFTNRFSLGGRAGVAALVGKQKQRYQYENAGNGYIDETEIDQNRIITDPARIILSAYF